MKAVIIAGQDGKNLRPLTCNIPLAMVRICSKPILKYILDLLSLNGCDKAAITLGYLPSKITDEFPNDIYKNIFLDFIDSIPIDGQAQLIKTAAYDYNEDFMVIKGDIITSIDLNIAMEHHKMSGADVTIITTQCNNPIDRSLISINNQSKVDGIINNPSWANIVTNTIDAGIYIFKPEVLKYIQMEEKWDINTQLLPYLLEKGIDIRAYEPDGYIKCINSIDTYISCQRDVLDNKIKCYTGEIAEGIYCKNELPKGDYTILPPVYFGGNIAIGNNTVIGPYSVIEDGCSIGKGANIKGSLMLTCSTCGDKASLTGAVICSGAKIKKYASVYEDSIIGNSAVIGEGAAVNANIAVWPGKKVENKAIIRENLRYGLAKSELFDDEGISGTTCCEITPELCSKIGAAIGSIYKGARIGVGCGFSRASSMMKMAVISGILSSGAQPLDFGSLIYSQFNFSTSFCGIKMGIYISSSTNTFMYIIGEGGLPISRNIEREIESRVNNDEFIRCGWDSIKETMDMTGMGGIYRQELIGLASGSLIGLKITVKASDRQCRQLLNDTLEKLDCGSGENINVHIGGSGRQAAFYSEETGYIWPERVLAMSCIPEFENGRDVALPADAPAVIDEIAAHYGRKVKRYMCCPTDGCDKEARLLAAQQHFTRDGFFQVIKILDYMKQKNITLAQYNSRLPEFSVVKKAVYVSNKIGGIMRSLNEKGKRAIEGIEIDTDEKCRRMLVKPTKRGKMLQMIIEAIDTETASELCSGLEKFITENNMKK